jgi:hypothetical protein
MTTVPTADTSGAVAPPDVMVDATPEEIAAMRALLAQVDAANAPAATVAATGAPAAVAPADVPPPPDPTFTAGQLVIYEWTDAYDVNPQVRYGIVVDLPTVGEADVPEADQIAGYGIAWLSPGHGRIAAADLKAV